MEQIYFHQGSMRLTAGYRSLLYVPMLLHLYLLSFGQLQLYILFGQPFRSDLSRRKRFLSAPLLNTTFIAGLVLLFVPFIVSVSETGRR